MPARLSGFALVVAISAAVAGCGAQPARVAASGPDPVAGFAADRLAGMTLHEKVASLLMLHRPGTDGAALRAFVDAYGLGGLILMGDNVPASAAELRALTTQVSADPGLPVLVGIDQEGGTGSRLLVDRAPGAGELRSMPVRATTAAFRSRSALLEKAGITVNFGIVADAGMVMFGHLAYPAVDPRPASLSPVWHRILREELGFDGVAITDDMLMLRHSGAPEYANATENAIAALRAATPCCSTCCRQNRQPPASMSGH